MENVTVLCTRCPQIGALALAWLSWQEDRFSTLGWVILESVGTAVYCLKAAMTTRAGIMCQSAHSSALQQAVGKWWIKRRSRSVVTNHLDSGFSPFRILRLCWWEGGEHEHWVDRPYSITSLFPAFTGKLPVFCSSLTTVILMVRFFHICV